jgi:hypothetical protein
MQRRTGGPPVLREIVAHPFACACYRTEDARIVQQLYQSKHTFEWNKFNPERANWMLAAILLAPHFSVGTHSADCIDPLVGIICR